MDDSEATKSEQDVRLEQANKLFQVSVMLIYGKRKSVDRAIKCIQKAITLDESNYKYWQLLGEAYYQRGSLTPSINCFLKSLNLAEDYLTKIGDDVGEQVRIQADSTYSRLRMSDIRLSVQRLDEAISGYSDIIESDPKNVAALVGMSRAELLIARNNFYRGLYKSGLSHCMEALKYALKSVKLSPHLCSTWKLASDCCLFQVMYGQRSEFSARLEVANFPGCDQSGGLIITRLGCIEMAQQFLCKALTISPFETSSSLWHNLGISLFLKSTSIRQQQQQDLSERRSLLKRSLKCLLKALNSDRLSSQVRNSIAIVAYHLNLLNTAQSFLIKSIQTNMSTSEIQFSNLGYVFLQRGEFRLAAVAFNRGQAEEPAYTRSWLGNALVNERKNVDNMSQLRHCFKLENNYESQMMYATKVVSLPHTEDYSKDLIHAMECLKRLVIYDQQSVAAENTLGLVYERSRLNSQALKCFELAHSMAPSDSRVLLNRLRHHSTLSPGCMLDPSQADKIDASMLRSAERLADGGNLEYMLNFIYYLFKNGDYATINTKINKVIEKLPQNDVQSKIGAQILLAMADRAQGSDYKSWLFKNIIDSDGSVNLESLVNLFCLILFGSLSDDKQLTDQVSGDLSRYLVLYLSAKPKQFAEVFYSMEGVWLRLTLVTSIFCNPDPGKLLRPMVALFPHMAELWLFLGLSLMFDRHKYPTAVFCIRKANTIGSTNANLSVVCDILLAMLLSKLSGKPTKKAAPIDPNAITVHLSRALFRVPNYKLLWDCLNLTRVEKAPKKYARGADVLSSVDGDLFQLVIDHIIKTITT